MRLLSLPTDGDFSLAGFLGNNIPAYAILSHTWGSQYEEVTYQYLQQNTGKEKTATGNCHSAESKLRKTG
ncbi:hypothetical protein DE146DRAFT_647957 [Phaeosphaeria sp. MPI-PUGE-AT-0046c]|nr:hypothetical protein DE146DRAFT_647957 [Phaeosphaeria sp. MPI-PUGE-AT-0046c]